MGAARKTKDYQAVIFDHSGRSVTREAKIIRAADVGAARDKIEKAHGPAVVDGQLMWTVGAIPGH